MNRGVVADILVFILMVIGIVNFFAQFVVPGYESRTEITMGLFGIAGVILGAKGIGQRSGKDKE